MSTLQAGHYAGSAQESDLDVEEKGAINTVQAKQDPILEMLRTLTTILDHLEMKSELKESSEGRPRRAGGGQDWKEANHDPIKCGKEGHFAIGCAAYRLGN